MINMYHCTGCMWSICIIVQAACDQYVSLYRLHVVNMYHCTGCMWSICIIVQAACGQYVASMIKDGVREQCLERSDT